jgi:hypothetical protein
MSTLQGGVSATRTKSIAAANEVQQGTGRDARATAGETPALRPRQRLSSLRRLGSGLADCECSERVPAPSYLPPSWCYLAPANCLSFQQHSRLERLSTFVIIDIPASGGSFPEWPFVFNNIRASFVHFLKVATFSLPCPKRHRVPCWPAKSPLGSGSPQIACAVGGPKRDPTRSLFPVP